MMFRYSRHALVFARTRAAWPRKPSTSVNGIAPRQPGWCTGANTVLVHADPRSARSPANSSWSCSCCTASGKQPSCLPCLHGHLCGESISIWTTFSRKFCTSSGPGTGITEKELKKEIDELTDHFMETRELLADAMEAQGTVYFNDDLEDAKESLQETLIRYQTLLGKLSEEQKRSVQRTIGLKMEELRAQEAMILESLGED